MATLAEVRPAISAVSRRSEKLQLDALVELASDILLWTSRHQMSLNGKGDDFTREDIRACAATAGPIRGRAESMLDEVQEAVSKWRRFADEAGVAPASRDAIQKTFRRL